MKWIELSKAKNLEFNAPVFTKSKDGVFGMGRLVEKRHTALGLVYTFEAATFAYDQSEPSYVTDITHIAIPK